MDNKTWFKTQAKFGMMIHWGLYSILGGEYKGERMGPHFSEWAQSFFEIPCDEYNKLTKAFNPIYFDAEEWVKCAKDAGMTYMVVTSKHHDGFALFKSEASDFNVVDATPFKRDIIKELSDACRKYGLKFGLYYSQELDWHEFNGGGYDKGRENLGVMYYANKWDFKDDSKKDFDIYFRNKVIPQVTELLTNYGDICLMWFDMGSQITEEQSQELYDLVKSIQPDCLVNSRIGNKMGDYRSLNDNALPSEPMDDLAESPITMNQSWGYKYYDNNWKDVYEIFRIKNFCNRRGANLLLNIGPDHLGRFPVPCSDVLTQMSDMLKKFND